MARLIAISGKQLSGKSTLKARLRAELEAAGHEVIERSFAVPLKRVVAEVLGLSIADVNAIKSGRDGEDKAERMRRLLQHVGTDSFRAYDDNVWVSAFMRTVDMDRPNAVYIVDDARFPNEADTCRAAGGFLVRLDITPEAQAARGLVKNPKHASETALDDYAGFDTRLQVDEMTPDEVASAVLFDFIAQEASA